HYNNINPGQYRFRVMACNSDGVWNESASSLGLYLAPHYWQTWWFQILAGIAIVVSAGGAILSGARWRLQRKLKHLQQQAAVEKERGRIAKDIHDDLGSSLTRIMMLGERVAEDINKPEALAKRRCVCVSPKRRAEGRCQWKLTVVGAMPRAKKMETEAARAPVMDWRICASGCKKWAAK